MKILNCILKFALLNFIILVCFARPISSEELIKNAEEFDGREIKYQGEAIGEVMVRGNYSWINVKDKTIAIGVWARKELTDNIIGGSYKKTGDILEIIGTFNKNCYLHGGDIDIHAREIKILKKSEPRNLPLDFGKIKILIILVLILLVEIIVLLILKIFRIKANKSKTNGRKN